VADHRHVDQHDHEGVQRQRRGPGRQTVAVTGLLTNVSLSGKLGDALSTARPGVDSVHVTVTR